MDCVRIPVCLKSQQGLVWIQQTHKEFLWATQALNIPTLKQAFCMVAEQME